MITLTPEERTEVKIGMWLKVYGCNFFLNRGSINLMNAFPYKLFKVKGSSKKPDLVFYDPKNNEWNAVELKTGEHGGSTKKGSKIIQYYDDYIQGIAKYFVDNNEIKISNFLVGTFYSPNGKIYSNDDLYIGYRKQGSEIAIKMRLIPKKEFIRTAEFIRSLWVEWGKNKKDINTGLGLLLSDCLDNNSNIESFEFGSPAIFTQRYYNNRWNQSWQVLK
jgi:hypothetical protein